ncbi:hypothetical protein DCCM_3396 [Desulfocucumis palustris]|uniref:Uncharacterized protein n=1 Tax=Desulfocucumis palustris TaxID=1898651 RepID=A0A2L2XE38_9FIRM|nr:hypothetical protein DCCM_3396 [Desulfocucumis palustris]
MRRIKTISPGAQTISIYAGAAPKERDVGCKENKGEYT